MPSLGKTINLYLMDGAASGRWQATLSNWNGAAYKIPRGELKNCSDLPELNNSGVYFLFGKDDESGKQFIYVGEADDVLRRLLQPHTFEKDGAYWIEAVIFVTPDGTLEKGRVKYLENRFYTIVTEAKRYMVKNGNTPPQSPMPKQIRDLLEEFIINAQLVLPALGHKVFEPLPSSDSGDDNDMDDLLYFARNQGEGGRAIGKLSSEGFWVLKGSYIYPKVAAYTASGIKSAREQYAAIIDKNGILQEDVLFGSPSYASTFVCGKNSNGLVEWKNKNGVPLKKLDIAAQDTAPKQRSFAKRKKAALGSMPGNKAIFQLAGKKVSATGWISGDGFVVCKGAGCSATETKSCHKWIRDMRARLMAEGKIKDYIFTEDVFFKSTSAAAACVTGRSVNGNIMWLNQEGKTIKELKAIEGEGGGDA